MQETLTAGAEAVKTSQLFYHRRFFGDECNNPYSYAENKLNVTGKRFSDVA
jgi:hypothetical protein